MGTYAGIDLHSSNNYIGIMDQDYKRLFGRRQPNDLTKVLKVLEPFKAELEGMAPKIFWGLNRPGAVF